jgi:pimeloyl-ACP methyl ester carboxylesterase
VPSFDGVPIHYQVQGGGRPPLVFVHGWAYDGRLWDAQVEHFAATHQVVTLDLGGHGRSGAGRAEWTMAAFGEDVAAVVRHLGLEGVVLVGHSMGGPVIVEAARRLSGKVRALVPVDTLVDVEQRIPADQVEQALAGFQADYRQANDRFMRRWMFTKSSPPALIEEVVAQTAAMDPAVAIPALRHAWEYDAVAGLRGVEAPVVAVNADLYPTSLEANRRHVPQFDAVIVPGLGHYLMREDPPAFNRGLEEALRRIAKGGA